MERGVIKNRKYATQIRDFSGLRYHKITPTDIDGMIDFGNKLFILMEFKHINAGECLGQKLAIQRVVDNLSKNNINAVGIIAEHNTDGDIDCANCIVTEIRIHKQWHKTRKCPTVRSVIDYYLKTYGLIWYI